MSALTGASAGVAARVDGASAKLPSRAVVSRPGASDGMERRTGCFLLLMGLMRVPGVRRKRSARTRPIDVMRMQEPAADRVKRWRSREGAHDIANENDL